MSRLLSLALLPAVILLSYIYHLDTIEKEPLSLLLRLFFLGCLCAIPASILEWLGEHFLAAVHNRVLYHALYAFGVVAVAEEGCKFFFLRTVWNHPAFDYRFDAIVYAVCVSLGFAALENVLYVIQYGFGTGLFRALTSVPGHCFFGVAMGYWLGHAKFSQFHRRPFGVQLVLSFLVPMILHGFYDFCCFMSGNSLFLLLFYIYLAVFFYAAIRCVRKASACDLPLRPDPIDFGNPPLF